MKNSPFFYYIVKNARPFFIGISALFVTNIFDALPPLILAMGVDQLSSGASSEELFKTSLYFFLALFATAFFRLIWRTFFGTFHNAVAEDLRNRLFAKFTSLGPNFYLKKPIGELMSLVTNDVTSFQRGIGPGVLILLDSLSISLIVIPVMISLSPDWTWKTMILLPLIPFLISKVMKQIFTQFKKQQEKYADYSGAAQELLSGIKVVKGYVQEENQAKKLSEKSYNYEVACNHVAKADSLFSPVMEFGVATGSVILLYISTPDLILGQISLGTFVAFHRYIQKMVWPMSALGIGLSMIQRARASYERIEELFHEETDTPDHGDIEFGDFDSLEVSNLSFTYPGEDKPTLKNVSFQIQPGTTTGIVGPIGSGKTTIANLLCRLYPVAENSILVNKTSIEKIRMRSLRDLIGLVPQDPFLFSESVEDNIAFALDDTPPRDRIEAMAQVVRIRGEIEEMPAKFNSQLGERGVNLSGGQKQRLTLARALIRETPVIILDDSLSAVDANTETSIESYLKESRSEAQTRIIISHRISSIEKADQIIVLNEGSIEALGRHEELLEKSQTYQNLFRIQNEKREAHS